jgi:hypothetical protein
MSIFEFPLDGTYCISVKYTRIDLVRRHSVLYIGIRVEKMRNFCMTVTVKWTESDAYLYDH